MERKAGASPSAGSLSGWRQNIPARRSPRTRSLEVKTGKLLGRARVHSGAHAQPGCRAGRVRAVWGADLGLSPESLPQMPFDSVQRKLTDAPCDTAHLCILLWTWLFCWELSVGWVLTQGGEGPMSGKLELSPEQTRPIPQKAET